MKFDKKNNNVEILSTYENSSSLIWLTKNEQWENDKSRMKKKLFINQTPNKMKAIKTCSAISTKRFKEKHCTGIYHNSNAKTAQTTQTTQTIKPQMKHKAMTSESSWIEDNFSSFIESLTEPNMCTIPETVNNYNTPNHNNNNNNKTNHPTENTNQRSGEIQFINNEDTSIDWLLNSKQEEEFSNPDDEDDDDEKEFENFESKKPDYQAISRNQRTAKKQEPWTNSNNTIDRIFCFSTEHNVSHRWINDEMSQRIVFPEEKEVNTFLPASICQHSGGNFNFINYLSSKTTQLLESRVVMHKVYQRLLALPCKTFFNIIIFLYDDLNQLSRQNRLLTNKIKSSIFEQVLPISRACNNKYSDLLWPQRMKYSISKTWKNNKISTCFDIWWTYKIKNNIKYHSNSIRWSYNYTYHNNKIPYINYYQFDILSKPDISTFFLSDIEGYETCYKRFSNCQQIQSFALDDNIVIRLNICSTGNSVNLSSIVFHDIHCIPVEQKRLYEKDLTITKWYYDKFRSCDVEQIIHLWKDYQPWEKGPFKHYYDRVRKVVKMYEPLCDIETVLYDKIKYWYFKIRCIARKVGVVKGNFYYKCNWHIVPRESTVENESICLANYNVSMKNYQIRTGEKFIWYLVED